MPLHLRISRNLGTLILEGAIAFCSASLLAQAPLPSEPELKALAGLPHYAPPQQIAGTIRVWGHGAPGLDFMGMLFKAWVDGFAKFQPNIKFEYDMYGTASAMGALYAGKGDIAILGQEIYPFETVAFNRVKHYSPTEIEIATGSVDVRNFDFAIGTFVNSKNPLTRLTLPQLNRIFAFQDTPAENIVTWGQLGLTGDWADKPIHLYGWHQDDVFSTFVQFRALDGNHRWRCEMKQYRHIHNADGTIYDSGQQILDDLAKDPYGMALSNVRYLKGIARDATKPLALARNADGPYYEATKATLIDRQYPLGRIIPAEIDRKPGRPVDPAVKEFLTYLLSREGQGEIVRNGKYLPMQPAIASRQLEKLQ
ncbi:PstS family phosphate ABC transporter substrate-binding protein [Granulicella tundricola]|nr:substrate-binding domain-containing protein [Granulicella tundricola]